MFNLRQLLILMLIFFSFTSKAQLFVNEVMSSNNTSYADANGEYDDWIEIFNSNTVAVNLANYYISDDAQNPLKWQIPATNASATTIAPSGHLILWADQQINQGETHIGFKLSSLGESIVLTKPDGVTVEDNITFPSMLSDNSYGRLPDGLANPVIFSTASPNTTNANNLPTANKPLIFPASGSYSIAQNVILNSTQNATIYYTTNGADPTTSSSVYNGTPIIVSSTQVIKAIAVLAGYNNSQQSTEVYAINESSNVPMVFLTTDSNNLFDDTNGIYCDGTNGVQGGCGVQNLVNYYQDWERPGNVVYIEPNGNVAFNKNMLLEISGGCTRHLAKKSINFKFDNNEDGDEIEHKMFDTKDALKYYGFKLRNFGNWCWQRRIDDALLHRVMENNIDLDMQSSQLVSVYLNGQYWGVYNLRDRTNKNFIKTHHTDIDEDNLDFFKNPLGPYQSIKSGDTIEHQNLVDFIINNDLNIPANYEYYKSKVDINSQINYSLSHIYYNARDWPGNNSIIWKEREPNSKFRFISFDLDSYLWNPFNVTLFNNIILLANPPGWKQDEPIASIYKRPFESDAYTSEFAQRMRTYIETIWNPANVLPIFNDLKTEMAGEIQADLNRWDNDFTYGYWLDATRFDLATWQTDVDDIYTFFVERPAVILPEMDNFLGNPGDFNLTIYTSNNTNGYVTIHSEYIKLPIAYTAAYFKNTPIQLLAVANPGYRFSHWQETGSTDAALYQSFSANTILTPIFVAVDDLVINEIFYNPTGASEDAEFIEIYNPDSNPRDLRGYKLNDGVSFEFQIGAVIQPNEYIIIAKDKSLYAGNGYQVFEWEKGSLSNGGETITLSNPNEAVIDSIAYDDSSAWPSDADGAGYSLALLDENLNNDLANNWKIQYGINVSPGVANQFCNAFTASFATVNNVSCNGGSDGFIQTTVSGANNPISYNWSNGSTNAAATNLPAGNYMLTINDGANCIYSNSQTITEPIALSSSTSTTDLLCNGDSNGTASINVNGGTTPYNYSWSNGSTSQNIISLAGGTYSINVTDNKGCQLNNTITINEPSAINLSSFYVDESVAGANDGVINLAVTGGTSPYTYQWSSGQTFQDINNLAPGTYTVVVTDNNNCTETHSVTILPGITPCTIPNNIVANNLQNTSATISWSVDANVSNYEVQYRISGINSWTTFSSNYSFAILNNLVACTTYEVRIRANCPSAQTSYYSTIYSFQTDGCVAPCDPIVGLFSQNITTSSAFLVWDIVPNATYTMFYRAVGNANWFSYPTQFPIAILFTLPSCTNFEWYVQVNCINGQISNPSPIANFTTVGAACKVDNENNAVSLSNSFNVNIYPNPVQDKLFLQFENNQEQVAVNFNIYSINGKLLINNKAILNKGKIEKEIKIMQLSTGTYFIQIIAENINYTKQFIKQ